MLMSAACPASDTRPAQPAPPSLANRLTVAILGFENKTGDASNAFWRIMVAHLVEDALDEAKGLRILPAADYALRQVHKKSGGALSTAEAAQAGKSIDAHRVVWGSYDRKNGKWLLTVRVLNPVTGNVSGDLTSTSADWFEVRDETVKKVLAELGVRPTAAERKKMSRRATSSLAAFEFLAQATALHADGKPLPEIKDIAGQAVAADPHYPEAQLVLGSIFGSIGDLESAEKSMRRALELRPDYAAAHRDLAIILALENKFESAEPELRAALQNDPDDVETWVRLGELCGARGALDSAVENYDQALRLDAWSADAHARLGGVYALQGLHDKAMAELKQAELLADPDDTGDQQGLGQVFDMLHEISPAIAHYENLVTNGKKQGLNPKMMDSYEKRLKELKETLTPVYLSAAQPKDYDLPALTKVLGEKLSPAELTLVTNPLTCTPEMKRWAATITVGATNDLEKAVRLYDALSRHIDEGQQGRRTPAETFAVCQRSDVSLICQDYALVYVALARATGLKSYDVFVEEECDGSKTLHACAALFIADKVLLVDPMYGWFGAPHKKFTVLDDVQTIAAFLTCRDEPESARIALKLAPDWDYVQWAAPLALVNANRLDAARKALPANALVDRPGWQWDLVRAAFAMSEQRDADATAFLKKVIAENTDYSYAYAALGTLYAKQKKWVEARKNFQLAVEHCWEVAKANEYRAAIADIDETVGSVDTAAASEPIDAVDFLNRGDARVRHDEYGKAIADYDRVIELDPKSAKAFLRRGYCYEREGKNDRALADYQATLRFDPEATAGYECLGRLYEDNGHYPDAALNLQKAIELGTHDPQVYAHLAWILISGPDNLRDNHRGAELARKACILSDWKESGSIVLLVSAYTASEDNSAVPLAKMALSLPDVTKENDQYLHKVLAYFEDLKTYSASGANSVSLTNLSSTNQSRPAAVTNAPDIAQLKKQAQSGDHKAQARLANLLYTGQNGVAVDRV